MNENSEILSKLDKLKQNQAFDVPEGYFDTILPRIQNRISRDQKKQAARNRIFGLKPVYSFSIIATCSVFLVIIGIKILSTPHASYLKQDEIALILDNQILSIDETTLAHEIDTDNTTKKQETDLKYLIDNNIESSDILTEL